MPDLGLIGFPLNHSFSPGFFAQRFREWELHDFRYLSFPIPDLKVLPELILREKDLIGLNVTIPHKSSVLSYLNWIDPAAKEIGAVNTLKIVRVPELKIEGFNTDAPGFLKAYGRLLEPHGRALILGTGGASKAVAHALKSAGMHITMASRNPVAGALSYDDLTAETIQECTLVVNATPMGMFPNVDQTPPLPVVGIGGTHLLIDLVYNPAETKLMRMFRGRGAVAMNGIGMLHAQALLSWEIWMSDQDNVPCE